MGKAKKGRKGDPGFDDDFAEPEQTTGPSAESSTPPATTKPGRAGRKAKKKPSAADWPSSDDDVVPDQASIVQESRPASTGRPSKAQKATSFSILDEPGGGHDEPEVGEEQEDDELPEAASAASASAFDALQEDSITAAESAVPEPHTEDYREPIIRIAQVVTVKQHPKADRLKLCTVDSGSSTVQVVTNAANARRGLKVAFAGVGCTLPGTGTHIAEAKVRGVSSFGMLCSAFDLGWTSNADGVLVELPETAPVGKPCPAAPMEGASFGDAVLQPTAAPKEGGKGGKRKKKKDVEWDDDLLEPSASVHSTELDYRAADGSAEAAISQPSADDTQEPDHTAQFGNKPKRKGKKKSGADAAGAFAALGMDEEAKEEPAEAELTPARPGRKASGTTGKQAAGAFAALGLESDADDAETEPKPESEPEPEPEPEPGPEPQLLANGSKGPAKNKNAASAFAALGISDSEEEAPEAAPQAAAKQKGGQPKGKSQDAPGAAALGIDVSDEASRELESQPELKAKVARSKTKDVAGAFAALGIDDSDEEVQPAALPRPEQPEPQQNGDHAVVFGGKKKKKASKKTDVDSIFAALDGGAAENGEAVPVPAGTDDADATMPVSPDEAAGMSQPVAAPAKLKKKKAGKAAKTNLPDEDIDALLAELDGPKADDEPLRTVSGSKTSIDQAFAALEQDGAANGEVVPVPQPPADIQQGDLEPSSTAQGKKKKKAGKSAVTSLGTDDIDALLTELDGPQSLAPLEPAQEQDTSAADGAAQLVPEPTPAAPEPPAAEDKKKGKKKKGGKAPAQGGEDIDALLAELGEGPSHAAPQEKPVTEALTQSTEAAVEAAQDAGLASAPGDAADDEEAGEGKELSAAQKKKLKKKAKAKAATGGGDEADAEAAQEAAPAPAKKGAAKKAAGGKGPSAALRKLQEEVERRKAAEDAARQAEEERIRQEEEAARRQEEEEARKLEEAERRKQERKDRRAEMKRQGLILTGKAKKEAERLAAFREQLLASQQNGPNGEAAEGAGEAPARRKPVYGKKKPAPKKPSDADTAEAEEATQAAAEAEEARRAQEAREAEEERRERQRIAEAELRERAEQEAAAAQESEADDNWEDMDLERVQLPAAAAAEADVQSAKKQKLGKQQELDGGKGTASIPAHPAAAVAAHQQATAIRKGAQAAQGDGDEDEGSSEEESEEESSSEAESTDSEEAAEARLRLAREKREERLKAARLAGSKDDLRSPICCILGHVDTGKTKLLDNIRRSNVQEGEAGGITQQIGATYVPGDAIQRRTESLRKGRDFDLKLPGLLIIDTPGHESFSNLRSRGSSLCDIAVLVVDLMHSLEPQTIESINLLKMRKTPFIIALNKVDRLFDWKSEADLPIRESMDRQKPHVLAEFEKRLQQTMLNLNEQGLNVALYWKNPDPRKYVSIVPTSAITGEGIPDMLQIIIKLTQAMMAERLMFLAELQATVLEVKVVEGLGTTVDIVLVNGVLREGETIVLCGLQGPIVTTIRSLLTPHPLKEMRVRGMYDHPKEVKAARGIKIAAQNLEHAVAGTQMLVARKDDDIETLKEEVMEDMQDIFGSVDRSGEGVCVQASTLGALEALLEFLRSPAVKISVSGINIGPVHKRDVMRASVMLEKNRKKFACVLAFDVPVNREAQELADSLGVKIFTADIIYHLFDQFTAYLKQTKEEEQEAARFDAVFPCILSIMPAAVFNKKDPIVVGVDVVEGIAKVGTPLCVPSQGGVDLGRIASMELNHKVVDVVRAGESVAMKIEATRPEEATRLYGRHFDHKDALVSRITRKSIDVLKQHFQNDMTRADWQLIIKLKKVFQID